MYPKFRFQFAKYTISEAFVYVSLNKNSNSDSIEIPFKYCDESTHESFEPRSLESESS